MKWVIILAIIGASVSWWMTNGPHRTQAQNDAWWSSHAPPPKGD